MNKIFEPLSSLIEEAQKSMQDDFEACTLSFTDFTTNLLFGIIYQIKSIGKLILEIKTSRVAKEIGLPVASKSLYPVTFLLFLKSSNIR